MELANDLADPESRPGVQRRMRQLALVAAAAMLLYLGLSLFGDGAQLRDALRQIGPGQWLVLVGCSLLNYLLRFLRWRGYLRALGTHLPLLQDGLIYLAGFAFTLTPGKAGEAVRSLYLRSAGVPWSRGLAALAVERLLDAAAMVLLAVLVLDHFGAMRSLVWVAIGVVVFVLLITRPGVVQALLGSIPDRGRLGHLLHGFLSVMQDARVLLAMPRLLAGLGLGLIAWAAEGVGFFLTLAWLGHEVGLFAAVGVYAAAVLAGALSFLPGGLGGTEAAMVALLLTHGVPLASAVLATLICRALTLWFAVLLGVVAILFLGRHSEQPALI